MVNNVSTSWRRILAGTLLLGFSLLAAGCRTTYLETTHQMANQRASQHVKGWRSQSNRQ
jgi:hypothetical protein